jgi:predicted CopG family antitoxin
VQKDERQAAEPLSTSDITISAEALEKLRQLKEKKSMATLEEEAAKQVLKNGNNGSLPREDLERIAGKLDKRAGGKLAAAGPMLFSAELHGGHVLRLLRQRIREGGPSRNMRKTCAHNA